MSNINPRGLSDEGVRTLIEENLCPMCLGELDTGWECNQCGYDALPIAHAVIPRLRASLVNAQEEREK